MNDLLRPLLDAIETVRTRISNHRTYLEADEKRTRVCLVDPILQALGWDPSDPESVALEWKIEGESADYALLGDDGGPVAIVEAKKLGTSLGRGPRRQTGGYVLGAEVGLASLTDGDSWEIYDLRKVESGEVRSRVDVSSDESHVAALKLLELWRPRLCSRRKRPPPPPPVTGEEQGVDRPEPPHAPSGARNDWVPFERVPAKRHHPPRLLRFEDESDERSWSPSSWADVVRSVVRRLYERGYLTDTDMPIRGTRQKHFVRHHREVERLTGGEQIQGTPFAFSGHGDNDTHKKRVGILLQGRGAPSLLARPGQQKDE